MRTNQSAVQRCEGCPRLWAWGAISRIWEPRRAPNERGDELHAVNEAYVRYGLDFPDTPIGRVARLGAHHLPTAADMPEVEQESVVKYGPHEYTLKPDLRWLAPVGLVVMDYKTCDHFGFALTPSTIRMEMQPALYAYAGMVKYDLTEATVVWLYYKCSEPYEVRPVETTFTRDGAQRVLRAKSAIVDKMEDLKRTCTHAMQVVGNEAHCPKYKGCYYRPRCFPDRYEYDETGVYSREKTAESFATSSSGSRRADF